MDIGAVVIPASGLMELEEGGMPANATKQITELKEIMRFIPHDKRTLCEMYSKVILFLFCSSLYGCDDEHNIFSDYVKGYEEGDVVRVVCAGSFDAPAGTYRLFVSDCTIVCQTRNASSLFEIVTSEGTSVGSFGTRGRAGDEFFNTIYIGGERNGNGDNLFWINDMMRGEIKLVDPQKSMEDGRTAVVKRIRVPIQSPEIFIRDDSSLMIHKFMRGRVENVVYDYVHRSMEEEDYLQVKEEDTYRSCLGYGVNNVSQSVFVMAMQSYNQINFWFYDKKKKIAMVYEGKYYKKIEEAKENHIYYSSIAASDSLIYALYLNQNVEDDTPQKTRIHVFTWRGDFVTILECKEYFDSLAIDEKNNLLYGLYNEIIYKYNLNDLRL